MGTGARQQDASACMEENTCVFVVHFGLPSVKSQV